MWIECTNQLPEINEPVMIEGRDGVRQEAFLTAGGFWNMDGHLEPPGYAVRWKAAEMKTVRCIRCEYFQEDRFDSLGFCRLCQDLRDEGDTCRLGRRKEHGK